MQSQINKLSTSDSTVETQERYWGRDIPCLWNHMSTTRADTGSNSSRRCFTDSRSSSSVVSNAQASATGKVLASSRAVVGRLSEHQAGAVSARSLWKAWGCIGISTHSLDIAILKSEKRINSQKKRRQWRGELQETQWHSICIHSEIVAWEKVCHH